MWITWSFPIFILVAATALAIPVGLYMTWVFEGKCRLPRWLSWLEQRIDTGPQNWKQYLLAFMVFNVVTFVVGYIVLVTQPYHGDFLNPDHKGALAPTTIFNTVTSFLTNTNLQDYSGEIHLSYGSQLFFICWKQILSPIIGICALLAIIRGLRGDKHMGNFYLDMWRGVVYFYVPLCLIVAWLLVAAGTPMTMQSNAPVTTLDVDGSGQPQTQTIARGPVAAIVAVKQFGTNGGGFFGANSAHPLENPSAWANIIECVGIILVPIACLVMFGFMLKNWRHAALIYGVMLVLSVVTLVWVIGYDRLQPNPGLIAQTGTVEAIETTKDGVAKSQWVVIPPGGSASFVDRDPQQKGKDKPETPTLPGLPVEQSLGNLEGKELRFGDSAGQTWAALTTNTSNGSVNCMHDSLNPVAGLVPLAGMQLNCIWGGVGVGLINLLIYLVIAVFLAGLMVGRTPEYLGKKVEAKEMKLAALALLIHPLMILLPTGVFVATDWGMKAMSNPGAHGFSQVLYQFTSSSANNGSGFEGLGDTWGFNKPEDNPSAPAPESPYLDIVAGMVMLISRFVPIIAPVALAGSLALKKTTPFTVGTLRTDSIMFGVFLLGTIMLVGALLFMPALMLGPVAEHLGPIPFGN
jgi:K+-transporting ATPase ATPase A chain